MQPKSNTLSLIIFGVLVALSFVASMLLRNWLYPPKPELPAQAKALSDLSIRSGAMFVEQGVPGLGGAAQTATNYELAKFLADRRYRLPQIPLASEPKKEPPPAVAQKPAAPASQKPLVRVAHKEVVI